MKEKTKQLQTFILSLMMLVMGVAGAWADSSVTFTLGNYGDKINPSATGTGISMSSSSSTYSGGSAGASTHLVISEDNTITISASSSVTISQIVLTHTASDRATSYTYGGNTYSPSDANVTVSGLSVSNANVVLTAVGSARLHSVTVTYTTNGGGSGYTITYADNHSIGTAPAPTSGTSLSSSVLAEIPTGITSGYTFKEWCTDAALTTPAVVDTEINTATTLYANYTIDGSISSSPVAGSSVVAGDAITTTASSDATITGMYISQAGGERTKEQLLDTSGGTGAYQSGSAAGWGVSDGATLGTNSWVLSALLTDGTFYSDVLTNTFSVDVATPVISCSNNTVTISCATTGATIYYTTDGSTTPTSSSTPYNPEAKPTISENTTFKAIAIKGGMSSAVSSQECVYASAVTTLPVTFDFNASPFTPGNITGADNDKCSMTQNNHEIYFRGTSASEFSIVDDDTNYLHMTQNGSNNHYIAIPISGINGRIDIKVWTTTTDSKFKIRGYLAQGTTTVSLIAPSKPAELAVNAHTKDTKLFEFRMKDISATNGVLYLGVNSSSFQNIEKITIETPAHMLEGPASVTMGDGETTTVSIKNHSAEYLPALGTVPEHVSATFNPSTGELVITPKAIGTGNITLALDTNEDGVADDVDLSILVTVQGVTMGDTPMASDVYAYGADATALSVSASQNDGGTLNYQWYRNTINSTTGGTAISGATSASYIPSTTLAAEDASFYYCVVSSSKSTSAPKTSGVAYVLTSSTGRYFQMSNVAGNKSTSETSIEVTGQKIAGGEVTYYKGTDGKYVLRPDGYGHYFHTSADSYFKIVLPSGIAANDMVSVTVNAINGNTRGVKISTSSDFSTGHDFTTSTNADTPITMKASDAGLATEATTLYVRGYNNTTGYFTDLIIYTPGDVKISDPTPAEQTVGKGITPSAISVTASDGTGPFSYQWQYSPNGNDTWNDVTTGTGYTTATFTPAASSPDVQTTTYYRCIVTDDGTSAPKKTATSGVASVTVEGVTRDYYKISTGSSDDATFDGDGKYVFNITKTNYNNQTAGGATRSYWNVTSDGDGTQIWSGEKLNMKAGGKKCSTTTFYVEGAAAFTIICENPGSARTYKVSIDGVEIKTINASSTETEQFPIRTSGSFITLSNAGNDIFPTQFTFYQTYSITPTISVKKDGIAVTEATLYPPFSAEGAVDYAVESNSTGAITVDTSAEGYNSGIAEATYNNGILTVTPKAKGETTVTLNQAAADAYGTNKVTFKVTVKKAEVTMAFNYDKVVLTASELEDVSGVIPTAKMPTLTVTRADGTTNTATINWESDDANLISVVGSGSSVTTYTVTYHKEHGQGGARIYAYVNETGDYGAAVAYVDVVVQNGTSNNLPKGETIDVQEQFVLANDNGEEVVTLTYGGYKYNSHEYNYIDFKTLATKSKSGDSKDKWTSAASFNKYYIDGYQYNSNNANDAYNEYGYQLKGMTDDYTETNCLDGMWYKTTDNKPQGGQYGAYERIRPFALPCKGGYLKFEPKKSGVLTAYILQNGCIGRGSNSDQLSSKPRLGYWFDEDGWVQTNVTAVAKQPISDGNGTDKHLHECDAEATATTPAEDGVTRNLRAQMDYYWTSTNGDADIIPMLTKPYCNAAKNTFSDTKETGYIDNPYYWGDDEHVINNNKQIIPTRMTPVPYHNGYLVPEQCYVKYTLPVIAGKSYYFYGMMTKIGYVGMNFVEDESVLTSKGIAHEENTLHLKSDDNMGEYKFGGSSTELAQSTLFDEVTLPSNYRPNQWNTICLPFALSENQVEAAFGTGTQLAIYNGLEHSSAEHVYYVKYLRHVDQNILPGQPYLIYPTGTGVDQNDGLIGTVIGTAEGAPDNNKRITFNDVLIEKNKLKQAYASYGSNKDVDGGTGFIFTGTYQMIAMPQYSLFYSPKDGKLYRWTGTSTTPNFAAYHAYMHPNSSSVMQNGIEFSFSDDDITDLVDETGEGGQETGIVIVEEIGGGSNAKAQLKSNTKAYNLMGQEIDPRSAKGLVIVNGEKVMY